MVGPISPEERQSKMVKLKLGVAGLVGVSGGLVAVQSDGSLPVVVGAVLAGTVLGAALAWYVFPTGENYR
jgi:heme A synthase